MKVIKWIGFLVLALGFVLMLGTAGASDLDTITFEVIVIRMLISLAMMGIGFCVTYIIEKKENEE